MVMHILTEADRRQAHVDRLTSADTVHQGDGTDRSGEAVIDPAEMYIAACRGTARCRDPWGDEGRHLVRTGAKRFCGPLLVTPAPTSIRIKR
jgi:hypothetical protein